MPLFLVPKIQENILKYLLTPIEKGANMYTVDTEKQPRREKEYKMTNATIILNESIKLMDAGIIAGTGEMVTVEMADGELMEIEMPEAIHTYANWKANGYQVRKGEKAVAQFPIWKYTVKKAKTEDEEDTTKMYMVTASFFTASQVDKIQ